MLNRFFVRRSVWFPTLVGWASILLFVTLPGVLWFLAGEGFLASCRNVSSSVLVLESWIGYDGIAAAAAEFKQGGYEYVVSTGGPSDATWNRQPWSYSRLGRDELIRCGVPADRIVVAPVHQVDRQRTFETAKSSLQAIAESGTELPSAIVVFTKGVHARRSRLVFQRVFGDNTAVGVIAWKPATEATSFWWHSSERASDFLKESLAYPFELFFHSGRGFNFRKQAPTPKATVRQVSQP